MKAKLIKIGNSRGIRLPKAVLEQAGFTEEVEVRVREREIVLSPRGGRRVGWAEAARELVAAGSDRLLDAPTPTSFDEDEPEW